MTPDFPEGFQGAGPVFAAVPLGDPWYHLASHGTTTWVPENVDVQANSAFLDRGQAEEVADAQTAGELSRWDGLCGWSEITAARAQAEAARQAEVDAQWEPEAAA